MIRLICKECGAAQRIKLDSKNIMFLRVVHVMCPHCQHVFDWEHTEIIVRAKREKTNEST